jgi:hypothetical protein
MVVKAGAAAAGTNGRWVVYTAFAREFDGRLIAVIVVGPAVVSAISGKENTGVDVAYCS